MSTWPQSGERATALGAQCRASRGLGSTPRERPPSDPNLGETNFSYVDARQLEQDWMLSAREDFNDPCSPRCAWPHRRDRREVKPLALAWWVLQGATDRKQSQDSARADRGLKLTLFPAPALASVLTDRKRSFGEG